MLTMLLTWIQDPTIIIKTGGYLGIALFVFAESGVLFGIFFPGDSLLFAAGLLAATGFLNIGVLIAVVVLSAIAGDSIGYWFGTRVGSSLFSRPDSRFFKQEYVHKTQHFYEAYGGRAVVFARFVPIVRTIAPILAGVGSMKYHTFIGYNVLGGLLWGAGVVSLGYFLGVIVPGTDRYILPISLGIIVLSFLPIIMNALRQR